MKCNLVNVSEKGKINDSFKKVFFKVPRELHLYLSESQVSEQEEPHGRHFAKRSYLKYGKPEISETRLQLQTPDP